MTDIQALFEYRLTQAEEILADSEKMLNANVSSRSIINRAYYAMFNMVLALFLKSDIPIKTSKHRGILSIFNKDFIHTGKVEKRYSVMLYDLFEKRQIGDYQDFIEVTPQDAAIAVQRAKEFIQGMKDYINLNLPK